MAVTSLWRPGRLWDKTPWRPVFRAGNLCQSV